MTAGAELDYSGRLRSADGLRCGRCGSYLQLWQQLKTQLKTSGQATIFYEIEAPLVPVLMQMEQHGISLDEAAIADSRQRLGNKIESLEAAIFEQAQQSFNLNSPKQLGHILFDELKLIEKPKKTKTGQYQTNEQVLAVSTEAPYCRRHLGISPVE